MIYASLSTIRATDVKELVAYSSVAHAAIYLLSAFSNSIQGIEGAIVLGIAHGFVSSGLFICVGGILYERSHTRIISYYRGMAQLMPIFSILFFILCLGNAGTPLTLNFIGEFMSLFGIIERLPVIGIIAATTIVFGAAYSIFLYNRIAFGGSYTKHIFEQNVFDIDKREFLLLFVLVALTVILGVYPSIIFDTLHYSVVNLVYGVEPSGYITANSTF